MAVKYEDIRPRQLYIDPYNKGYRSVTLYTTNSGIKKEIYVDPNGRLYGTHTDPLRRVEQQLAEFEQNMATYPAHEYWSKQTTLDRIADLKGLQQALSQASNYVDVAGYSNYDLERSIRDNPQGWWEFFNANESNREETQLATQRRNTQMNREQSRTNAMRDMQDLLISQEGSTIGGRKMSNTGLTARRDMFSGGLEAGLNV